MHWIKIKFIPVFHFIFLLTVGDEFWSFSLIVLLVNVHKRRIRWNWKHFNPWINWIRFILRGDEFGAWRKIMARGKRVEDLCVYILTNAWLNHKKKKKKKKEQKFWNNIIKYKKYTFISDNLNNNITPPIKRYGVNIKRFLFFLFFTRSSIYLESCISDARMLDSKDIQFHSR